MPESVEIGQLAIDYWARWWSELFPPPEDDEDLEEGEDEDTSEA